jgi:hypothetical protein
MKKNIFIIVLIQIVTICVPSYTQDSIITKPLTKGLVTANKNLLYNLVTVVNVEGDVSRGFLVGLRADTLILYKDEQNDEFSVQNLQAVTINTKGNDSRGLLIGGILGMYLGNLAFFQVENQPTAYWRGESEGWKAIASILMAFVGGGVGYLIDISTQDDTEEFTFSGDKEDQMKELNRLTAFIKGKQLMESKVHLGVQMSQVNTRYSEIHEDEKNPYYYGYDEVTSFNLLRKIQLTYQIQEDLEIGGVISWFGEPSIFWYSNFGGGTNVTVTQTYDGVGYYAVAVYHPLASIFSKQISWGIGAGIGLSNVDFSFEEMRTVGSYPEITEEKISKRINKTVFSALVNTQFDLYLIKELSIGLMADYVFVTGEMPAILNTDISERSLGNFSFGLALGFHF